MRFRKNDEAVSPVIGVILMVAITVILAAVIAAFVFGMGTPTKAPQVQLKMTATSGLTGYLKISHDGGDSLILKDEKLTVKNAVSGAVVDTVDGMALYDVTAGTGFTNVETTLPPGSNIQRTWTTPPTKGDILQVTILDIPSGQIIANTKVTVN